MRGIVIVHALAVGLGSGCTKDLSDFPRDNPRDPEFSGQASCTDGAKNGDESDVDCGGSRCDPCPAQGHCASNSDCQSGLCGNTRCQACGDAVIWSATEQCDDGGTIPGDGCSAACGIETNWRCTASQPSVCYECGDGVVQSEVGEDCDDATDPYCIDCNSIGACGDGDVQTMAGEECDDSGPSGTCRADCQFVCDGLCVVRTEIRSLSQVTGSGQFEVVDAGFARADQACNGSLCVAGGGFTSGSGEAE